MMMDFRGTNEMMMDFRETNEMMTDFVDQVHKRIFFFYSFISLTICLIYFNEELSSTFLHIFLFISVH